jgi:hypothetical protein
MNLHISPNEHWLFVGDFNFYRSLENRNREGANFSDMAIFNEMISHLGLVELPIKGRAFTWSNMQSCPLLEFDFTIPCTPEVKVKSTKQI